MDRTGTGCFTITQLLAIAVMLLLVPLSALAAGSGSPGHAASSPRVSGDHHHSSILPDSTEARRLPSEEPLHCHLRTPHPPENGIARATVEGDLSLPASHYLSSSAREANMRLPAILARAGIPGPPHFILFGNFRS